ncbi:MAG: shikimate kinase [Desulfococcaceae bacterium]
MNIFLIGYRCTGKSTIGRMLAENLGLTFADADRELEKEHCITIAEMVARQGWEYFRQKEREILVQLCQKDNQIIAAGGGVILNSENIRTMKKSGTVIWLKADVQTITSRLLGDEKTQSQRPALTDKGLVDEIGENMAFRHPLYENAADISVDTDNISAKEICMDLIEKIR